MDNKMKINYKKKKNKIIINKGENNDIPKPTGPRRCANAAVGHRYRHSGGY